ncbi:MAG: hypothetical protein ACI39Q_07675 [Wujia sp.]
MKRQTLSEIINDMIHSGSLTLQSTTEGEFFGTLTSLAGEIKTLSLYSREFSRELRYFCYEKYGEHVSSKDVKDVMDELEMRAYKNKVKKPLQKRVFCDESGRVIYDLSYDKVVVLEEGKAYISDNNELLFRRNGTYKPQVEPDFSVTPSELIPLLKRNTNFSKESDLKLFTIYLVIAFVGLSISHPVLMIHGEKGSAKSSLLRKLTAIIDPHSNDISGMQLKLEDLQLKLYSDYFVGLDNLYALKRGCSDTLAISCTGGSISKRQLYFDTSQIVMDIKAVVAMTSVSMIIQESDLLDRSLILTLKRIPSTKMKTEEQMWEEFNIDLPKILGGCFNTLARALKREVVLEEDTRLIRLADFHKLAISVGSVLGMAQSEVDALMWKNQHRVNEEALNADAVAFCIMELMRKRTKYENSVAGLYQEIKGIAYENNIRESYLPGAPNHLTIRLKKLEENLKEGAGIQFVIKNVGTNKKIIIEKTK